MKNTSKIQQSSSIAKPRCRRVTVKSAYDHMALSLRPISPGRHLKTRCAVNQNWILGLYLEFVSPRRVCQGQFEQPLEFPGVRHHNDEVLVVVNGCTDTAVVVDELLLGYLAHIAHLDHVTHLWLYDDVTNMAMMATTLTVRLTTAIIMTMLEFINFMPSIPNGALS